jgi:hypothetical protein
MPHLRLAIRETTWESSEPAPKDRLVFVLAGCGYGLAPERALLPR